MRIFAEQFTDLSLGQTQFFNKLAVIPIHAKASFQRHDIKTFDELSALDLAEASEISEDGSVGTICVLNKSESYLAIFDNDIIVGAKQNRVAKSTVIIPPFEAVNLPVYCVERGRWRYENSHKFKRSQHSLSPQIREKKIMMMKSGNTHNIQHEVWNDVDELSYKLNAFSSTSNFTDVVGAQEYKCEARLRDFVENTKSSGYVIATGKKLFCELFFNEQACRSQSLKSIKSWLADVTEEKSYPLKSQMQIKEDLINSTWHPVNSIGVETAFEASGSRQGQSALLQDNFIHGLLYL
jgi:hypothetical protein